MPQPAAAEQGAGRAATRGLVFLAISGSVLAGSCNSAALRAAVGLVPEAMIASAEGKFDGEGKLTAAATRSRVAKLLRAGGTR